MCSGARHHGTDCISPEGLEVVILLCIVKEEISDSFKLHSCEHGSNLISLCWTGKSCTKTGNIGDIKFPDCCLW